jgi:hypothetical protein
MRNREAIPSKLKSGVVCRYKKWPHLEFAADDKEESKVWYALLWTIFRFWQRLEAIAYLIYIARIHSLFDVFRLKPSKGDPIQPNLLQVNCSSVTNQNNLCFLQFLCIKFSSFLSYSIYIPL